MAASPRITDQYHRCLDTGGTISRGDRRILDVAGADRASWLNNLVTQVVKTLAPGEGNYAFATNVKGRTVFDADILVLENELWIDLDARLADAARKHLEKFIITEDVTLTQPAGPVARLAILGQLSVNVAAKLGFGNLVPMAQLQHVMLKVEGAPTRLVRNDFAGIMTAEFISIGDHCERAIRQIESVAREMELMPMDAEIVEVLRIEAGIPKSVDDIDEDVIPPETGQIERGISYHKGCYLGQEVIERMRSHGVLARKLVGVRIESDELPPPRSEIRVGEQSVGETHSACRSVAMSAPLALAYLKSAHTQVGTKLSVRWAEQDHAAEVVSLPVRQPRG